MSNRQGQATSGDPAGPFDSFERLVEAHSDLLKRDLDVSAADLAADSKEWREFIKAVKVFISRGRATGALLDSDSERRAAQSMLSYWITVLYRSNEPEIPDPILALYDSKSEPEVEPELADELRPYVGLNPFREEDRPLFYGREQLIEATLVQLQKRRFIALVGPSGGGKSSFVLAGVLPALKDGNLIQGSDQWRYYNAMVPGNDPLANLAEAMLPPGENSPERVAQLAEGFLRDTAQLLQVIEQSGSAPAVLVIDQFEEVFTLCKDDDRRLAFINNLITLIEAPDREHRVILTVQRGVVQNIVRIPRLYQIFREGEMRIRPLVETELREAIEEPAKSVDLRFKPGIVEQLIKEILGDPKGLPLLQFALLKLWEMRERSSVTWDALNKLGDCRQAITEAADSFYAGLNVEEQKTARHVLLQMVRLSEGFEVTTNRVLRKNLHKTSDQPAQVDKVLDALDKAHLVRLTRDQSHNGEASPDDQIELAHVSLVRYWPKMEGWLRDEREAMIMRQRLQAYTDEWVALGRGSTGLLDEFQLHEAEVWLESSHAAYFGYDEDLIAFVTASRAAIEKIKREKEEAHEREVAQARERAEIKAKALRWMIAVALLLGAILVFAIFFAYHLRDEQRHTMSRELALLANGNLVRDKLDLALLLGVQASRLDDKSPESLRGLLSILGYSRRLETYLPGNGSEVNDVAFGSNGERIVSFSGDGRVRFWDIDGIRIKPVNSEYSTEINKTEKIAFYANGKGLLSVGQTGRVTLRDVEKQIELSSFDTAGTRPASVKVSSFVCTQDGTKLALLWEDGTIELWDTKNKSRSWAHDDVSSAGVKSMALSPDGKVLARINDHGGNDLLSTESKQPRGSLKGAQIKRVASDSSTSDLKRPLAGQEDNPPYNVFAAFGLNGKVLAVGNEDGSIDLYDASTKKWLETLIATDRGASEDDQDIVNIVFSADGKRLICVNASGAVTSYSKVDEQETALYETSAILRSGRNSTIKSIAASPDNKRIAAGCSDGTTVVWNVEEDPEQFKVVKAGLDETGKIRDLAFSPDNQLFFVGEDNRIKIWDLKEEKEQGEAGGYSINRTGTTLRSVVINMMRGRVVAGYQDGWIQLWDITKQPVHLVTQFQASEAPISALAVSADCKRMAAIYDNTIGLWDIDKQSKLTTFNADNDTAIISIALSSDGKKLACGTSNGIILLWDTGSSQKASKLESGYDSWVSGLKFSPLGKNLISFNDNGTIFLWNIEKASKYEGFPENFRQIGGVCFRPDDKMVTVASDEGIYLWDIENQQEIAKLLTRSDNELSNIVYSPDGKTLAVGNGVGTITLFDLRVEFLQERACLKAGRDFTPDEWRQYMRDNDQRPVCAELLIDRPRP